MVVSSGAGNRSRQPLRDCKGPARNSPEACIAKESRCLAKPRSHRFASIDGFPKGALVMLVILDEVIRGSTQQKAFLSFSIHPENILVVFFDRFPFWKRSKCSRAGPSPTGPRHG